MSLIIGKPSLSAVADAIANKSPAKFIGWMQTTCLPSFVEHYREHTNLLMLSRLVDALPSSGKESQRKQCIAWLEMVAGVAFTRDKQGRIPSKKGKFTVGTRTVMPLAEYAEIPWYVRPVKAERDEPVQDEPVQDEPVQEVAAGIAAETATEAAVKRCLELVSTLDLDGHAAVAEAVKASFDARLAARVETTFGAISSVQVAETTAMAEAFRKAAA